MYGEARTLYFVGRALSDDVSERLCARGWTVERIAISRF